MCKTEVKGPHLKGAWERNSSLRGWHAVSARGGAAAGATVTVADVRVLPGSPAGWCWEARGSPESTGTPGTPLTRPHTLLS